MQAFGIQGGQDLALLHPVAFAHQDLVDAPAGIEGQFHLADVHVALQSQFGLHGVAVVPEPPHPAGQQRPRRQRQAGRSSVSCQVLCLCLVVIALTGTHG